MKKGLIVRRAILGVVIISFLVAYYDIFAYMAAFLFAFPTLCETLPETPRLGAFGDFLVFFWAEGLIAVSLVVAVITWLVRRYTRHRQGLVQAGEAARTETVSVS